MIMEKDTPRVAEFSREFNDLLFKLLEKDPIKRINWDEIKVHPFWAGLPSCIEFTKRIYPHQPQFDAYLQQRGIVPQHFHDMRSNPLAKKFGAPAASGGKVDIMRLSHNVRKNVKKEEDEQHENQYEAAAVTSSKGAAAEDEDDFKLKNRNMVLNFGEKAEEDTVSDEGKQTNSGGSTPQASMPTGPGFIAA